MNRVSRPAMRRRLQRAALFWLPGLAALAAGTLLACSGQHCPSPFDRAGLVLADALRTASLDRLMSAATWIGSLALLLPVAGFAAWLLQRGRRPREAAFVIAGLLGAAALGQLAKLWAMRPRPDLFVPLVPMPSDWSYPSAHAMQATALALALFLVVGRRRAAWAALLSAAVVLVSASRVYLQVHFPSDVIAGMFAGALWVGGLHALLFGPRRPGRAAQA